MKKIGVFLKKIDVFAKKTELKMNSHSKFPTKLGGFLTLVMITLVTLLFIEFGSDMLFRLNPSSISSEIYVDKPDITYLSREHQFFMFGLQNPSEFRHFIDESIYTATLTNIHSKKINGISNTTTVTIPIEKCSETHLPSNEELKSYFKFGPGAPLETLYCIKQGFDNVFYMGGSFESEEYHYFQISIKACKNSTDPSKPVCKSKEMLNEKLSGFFAFYTTDYLIDPTNYEDPGKAIGKNYYSPISFGINRKTNRFISTSRFNSDEGFLFSSKKNYVYPTFKEDVETFSLDSKETGDLFKFLLKKHHSEIIYERSYKKIQKVLAEIGGFIQAIYLIFFVFTYPVVNKLYFEKLINKVYNFEKDENGFKVTPSRKIMKFQKNSSLNMEAINKNIQNLEKCDKNLSKSWINIQDTPPLYCSFLNYFKGFLLFFIFLPSFLLFFLYIFVFFKVIFSILQASPVI